MARAQKVKCYPRVQKRMQRTLRSTTPGLIIFSFISIIDEEIEELSEQEAILLFALFEALDFRLLGGSHLLLHLLRLPPIARFLLPPEQFKMVPNKLLLVGDDLNLKRIVVYWYVGPLDWQQHPVKYEIANDALLAHSLPEHILEIRVIWFVLKSKGSHMLDHTLKLSRQPLAELLNCGRLF